MEHDSSDGRPPSDRVPSVWDVPGDFGDDTQWRAFDETEYEWEPFATQNPKPRRLLFIAATALFALASIAAGGGALWFLARDTEADDGPATEETSDPWITSSSALPTSALPSSALPTSAVPGAATGSTRRAEESARRPEPPEQPGERRGGVGGEVSRALDEAGLAVPVHRFGLPKEFIDHASRAQVLEAVGLAPEPIVERLRAHL